MKDYHWTPALQRAFIEAMAETGSVTEACRDVSMSRRAAYNLRSRREGLAFRIGWDAAALLARDVVAAELTDRALAGSWVETIKDPDTGRTRRLSHDRGLGLALLARLDRKCEFLDESGLGKAAQIASQDFEAFLDIVSAGGSPAAIRAFIEDREELWQTSAAIGLDPAFETKSMPVVAPAPEPANDCELARETATSSFVPLPVTTPRPGDAGYHDWIRNQPWARMG